MQIFLQPCQYDCDVHSSSQSRCLFLSFELSTANYASQWPCFSFQSPLIVLSQLHLKGRRPDRKLDNWSRLQDRAPPGDGKGKSKDRGGGGRTETATKHPAQRETGGDTLQPPITLLRGVPEVPTVFYGQFVCPPQPVGTFSGADSSP